MNTADKPVAIRVRELYAQGPGRWHYYEWSETDAIPKDGEDLEVLYARHAAAELVASHPAEMMVDTPATQI